MGTKSKFLRIVFLIVAVMLIFTCVASIIRVWAVDDGDIDQVSIKDVSKHTVLTDIELGKAASSTAKIMDIPQSGDAGWVAIAIALLIASVCVVLLLVRRTRR